MSSQPQSTGAPRSRSHRRFWHTGLAAALLVSSSPLALHAETSNAELAKEIAELKAQIREMKGALSETRSETRKTAAKVRVVAARGGAAYTLPPPGPAYPVGAVPAFVTADKKLIFGAITITPGGFVEAASVFRSKSTNSDISSNFAVPFANNILGHTNEAHFSARDTRLALLAEAPITPTFVASAYAEIDFNAAASTANENQTDSYTPRVRNLYATLDDGDYGLHVLAGQSWSLLTLNSKGITPRNEVTPAVIDSSQVVGSLYARQPGIRITKDFDKKLWVSLSAEESQTTGCPAVGQTFTNTGVGTVTSNSAVTSGLNGGGAIVGGTVNCSAVGTAGSFVSAAQAGPNYSFNHIPDVIGKVAYEARLLDRDVHLEGFGIYTDLYDTTQFGPTAALAAAAGVKTNDTTGYGVGGGLIVPLLPKKVDFQINGIYGRGINRYGPGQLPDAVVSGDGSLKAVQGYIGLAGLTLHATPAIDLFGYAGIEGEVRTPSAIGLGVNGTNAGNAGCFIPNGGCTGATHNLYEITGGITDKLYKGSFGEVRASATYSYVNRQIFSSPGTRDLATEDHIVFTSLRYYPFQASPVAPPPVIAKY